MSACSRFRGRKCRKSPETRRGGRRRLPWPLLLFGVVFFVMAISRGAGEAAEAGGPFIGGPFIGGGFGGGGFGGGGGGFGGFGGGMSGGGGSSGGY